MNWEAIEFDWNHARSFLVAAREGSFSAAAEKLDQSQPTLSRHVAALEKELGVTLFERVGRGLVLTETGSELLQPVSRMADAAGQVTLHVSGQASELAGLVRVSAGEAVAAYLLPSLMDKIHKVYPEIEVQLVVSNQISDLLRREADIAIRHVRPEQADLVAKKVRDTCAHLYASKSWIEAHGRPKELCELADAAFVGTEDNERFVEILQHLGYPVKLENFRWTTNNHVVGWQLVQQGLGVGGMLREVASRTPGVERLLPELPGIPVPYWLCTHRELHTSRRIRAVYDLLGDALQEM